MKTLFLFLSFTVLAAAQSTTTGAAVFTGSGLNDATSGGRFTALPTNAAYVVTISATGTPDHFTWTLNDGAASSPVAITGAAQTLSNGITIRFAATTGHTLADSWLIAVSATSSSSGVNYINGGIAASMRTSQNKLREVVSVQDFGAVANGTPAGLTGTDQSAAFQKCSNMATVVWLSVSCFIPYAGGNCYMLGAQVIVYSSVTFYSDNRATCVQKMAGSGIGIAFQMFTTNNGNNVPNASGVTDIHFRNFTLDGNKANQAGLASNQNGLSRCSDALVAR